MDYVAAIDISTLIWEESDYKANTVSYYRLIYFFPNLIELINSHGTLVLMREELKMQILSEFPYAITDSGFRDFQNLTLSFLADLGARMVIYPAENNPNILAQPQINKPHFSNETKQEIRYLITRLHNGRAPESKFFTFHYFWQQGEDLKTLENKEVLEIETICIDDEHILNNFFASKKKLFEHNPKHNLFKAGGKISKLSCYNERTRDTSKAQKLLENAFTFGGTFYNFDAENRVFVTFEHTVNNIYHGYDDGNVPPAVRSHFNK